MPRPAGIRAGLRACLAAALLVLPTAAAAEPAPLLALVDVETTGLDPAFHEMIDVGVIYAEADGAVACEFFLRIHPAHPERLDPGAAAVNGYDPGRWQALGAVAPTEAVARWRDAHHRCAGERRVTFVAFNVHFDQAFTSALLDRHGTRWRDWFHWQVLDLPSMAWAQGARAVEGAALAAFYGIAAETRDPLEHTGATGAAFNLALYRAILARSDPRP